MPQKGKGAVLYLGESADKQLDQLAKESGESRSAIVRSLIRAGYNNGLPGFKRVKRK